LVNDAFCFHCCSFDFLCNYNLIIYYIRCLVVFVLILNLVALLCRLRVLLVVPLADQLYPPPLQASWRCFAWSGAFSRLLTVPLAVPCCSEHHHQVAWAVVGCLVCLAVPRLVFASPAKIPPGGVVSDLPSLNAVTWGWRLPTPHLLEALGFGAVPQHTQYLPY
jgi:hypothetical protein